MCEYVKGPYRKVDFFSNRRHFNLVQGITHLTFNFEEKLKFTVIGHLELYDLSKHELSWQQPPNCPFRHSFGPSQVSSELQERLSGRAIKANSTVLYVN